MGASPIKLKLPAWAPIAFFTSTLVGCEPKYPTGNGDTKPPGHKKAWEDNMASARGAKGQPAGHNPMPDYFEGDTPSTECILDPSKCKDTPHRLADPNRAPPAAAPRRTPSACFSGERQLCRIPSKSVNMKIPGTTQTTYSCPILGERLCLDDGTWGHCLGTCTDSHYWTSYPTQCRSPASCAGELVCSSKQGDAEAVECIIENPVCRCL